ncbi:MAG: hypothetical protein LBS04_05265 [Tannerellaceae bacterium]|jgi:hypothetical protein|nr:hypothetical protein [Tannerellaceae bacterium]
MKKISILISRVMGMLALLSLLMVSCKDDNNNAREFEETKIVGVKIDNELFTPEYTEGETKVILPAGKDISNVKLQILVANGSLTDFQNEIEYDCRKPLPVKLKGYNGTTVETILRIQSPPKLSFFVIEGLSVSAGDVFESLSSLIVQVPETTDLTRLKVTMEFTNGTLVNFENGKELDYTSPRNFSVKGVDDETVYPYEFIITTEIVGPAFVKALKVNGIETDSVTINGTVLTPYVPALFDFTSANVELLVGYGNKIDPSFTGSNVNLMSGDNKVKVTGSNGIETEFTIGVPQLSFAPLFAKKYSDLGFASDNLSAIGFSGSYLLAANHSAGNKLPVIFSLTGENVGRMDATGVDATSYGIRKFATDDKGAVLVLSLGMSAGDQWVYKYDSATGQGSKYINFSKVLLGVDYNPRSAGISISGSLDGNATIIIPMAQRTDIFVWTVTGGVLNSTPQKFSFPYTGTSYYWSVQPMPAGIKGFTGLATANNSGFSNGIVCFDETMSETQKLTDMVVTDGKTIKHKDRIYLAYTAHSNSKGIMRICDITDGTLESYKTPIFNQAMSVTAGNTNATVDADLSVIEGKLHVAFACTNVGLYLYCLE